jgi:hypothetical protein
MWWVNLTAMFTAESKRTMKYFKILPAAVGIIALTTTFAFARDRREADKDNFLRIRAEACDFDENAGDISSNFLPAAIDSETGDVYLIEVGKDPEGDTDS